MYNVRLIHYPAGIQVRMYDKLYGCLIPDNPLKEQSEKKEVEIVENPFTGELVRLRSYEEMERSKAVSMSRTVNKLYYLTRSNDWEWFVTLTFDPDKIDSFDYTLCTKKLSKWLNNCKRICPGMKYMVVPELHKSGRYHFHGLFANCKELEFIESGHYSDDGVPIYNICRYNLGFTTATPIKDSVKAACYITKYITKDLCAVTGNKRRYWSSKNLYEAVIEDFVVEGEEKEAFLDSFSDRILHSSTKKTSFVVTDYYELEI